MIPEVKLKTTKSLTAQLLIMCVTFLSSQRQIILHTSIDFMFYTEGGFVRNMHWH